jgi:cysteine desulfuration protein SufE
MTPAEIKQKLIDDFSMFDDWMDKYDYLIEIGKNLPPIDDKYKNDEYKIGGCQSDVWLHSYTEGNKIFFEADSNAVITKGLIGLLINVYNGQSLEEVEKAEMEFVNDIGLKEQLTPSRSNGLMSMLKQMQYYAMAFKAKEK